MSHAIKRHQVRELAVQTLYLLASTADETLTSEDAIRVALILNEQPDEQKAKLAKDKYLKRLIDGVSEQQEQLDSTIQQHLKNWHFNRITRVDLAVLRLAVFEMQYLKDETPQKVALNEAIELAKQFSDEKSGSFINGILTNLLD